MLRPMTLTFRRVARTAALESAARGGAARLTRCNRRIRGCHITFEAGVAGQAGPTQYSVKIHLGVPGAQIHAAGPLRSGGHQDVLAALRDALDDAVRQLTALERQPSVSIAREFGS